ncbi:type IV pilus modification protein PilV [Gilvimarinus sp. DA14]|uniref:type IV pilus modification protein PilV n=1 Tax=Gilvimarinus sp. DA14 TaxID=2956798 RepID=UPI0020B855F7|nr:type IV pilus modification protein PilV [Gilvimarinus sp. DA14]UTF61755.1 type IV pilus modification protein PilV [Gilvimarinus sp. DA14]
MNSDKFYSGRETGVGLIEVLITVLVLSTALMALAALQTRSLQYNSSAYLRSQANIIAYDILEQMRASSSSNAVVTGGAVVEPDVEALAAQLPGGEGEVECAARVCTVRLVWNEPTANQAGDEIEQTTFEYVSRI